MINGFVTLPGGSVVRYNDIVALESCADGIRTIVRLKGDVASIDVYAPVDAVRRAIWGAPTDATRCITVVESELEAAARKVREALVAREAAKVSWKEALAKSDALRAEYDVARDAVLEAEAKLFALVRKWPTLVDRRGPYARGSDEGRSDA
jgi:hypothetical protein